MRNDHHYDCMDMILTMLTMERRTEELGWIAEMEMCGTGTREHDNNDW